MSIETIRGLDNILKNHDASSWIQEGRMEGMNLESIMTSPAPLTENVEVGGESKSFGQLLADSMAQVNDLQKNADQAIKQLVTGRSKNLHETMLAVERAEIAFKTMNQIRLKVIDAYKEVMRMQV